MNFKRFFEKFWISFRYAFRPHKPLLTIRLVFLLIKVYFFGIKPLRYVDFAVDYKCNLNCTHCFAKSLEKENKDRLTIEDYKRVVRESMALGAVNFSFQGGEPLIYKDLEKIIKACQPERNLISVTTNGLLLTPEKLKELRTWGVDILTVSLDSAIPEEHDEFRKSKGAFEQTLCGIREAIKQGFHITIGSTVYHGNIRSEGILKLCDLAIKLKCVLCFNLGVPVGNWANQDEILLTEDDFEYLNSLVKKSTYIRTDLEANIAGYGCGAIKEILYVTPYGDVFACPFIHISFGNVKEHSVTVIRRKGLDCKYFKNYYPRCLCAADREFINNYLSKTLLTKSPPIKAEEVFE